MSSFFDKFTKDKQRFITAFALIAALFVIGAIDSFFVVWAVLGVLYVLAFFESLKLFGIESSSLYIYAVLIWLGALVFPTPATLVFLVLIAFASVLAYRQKLDKKIFIPFLYPSVGFLFILDLYTKHSISGILWLIFIVAATDSGAYLIGKTIGKRPFCPASPNKTLEGVGGGVLSGLVVGSIYGAVLTNFFWAVFVSLLVSIASVFGDLFESHLKREAGVKDSGNILPGHGGILDRLDGYLFAAVLMSILMSL